MRFLLLLMLLVGPLVLPAQNTTIPVLDPVAEGQALRAEILEQTPRTDTESTGIMRLRNRQGQRTEIPVHFQINVINSSAWVAHYTTPLERLTVHHQIGRTNLYTLARAPTPGGTFGTPVTLDRITEIFRPFAGTEFWPADLGLDFFHWPAQRLLKKEMRKGRSCRVLESLNPAPSAGSYARVLSWVDLETNGLVLAEAYDLSGALIKEFSVRSFKKIEGNWQLKEMEIRNPKSDSRTNLIFDLGSE